MIYVVLRESELGKVEYDYYEKPLFFDDRESAELAVREWFEFLDGYPCCGNAFISVFSEL